MIFIIYGLNPYNIVKYNNIIIPIILIIFFIMLITFFFVQVREINQLDIEKYTFFKLFFKLFFVIGITIFGIIFIYLIGKLITNMPSITIVNYIISISLIITRIMLILF